MYQKHFLADAKLEYLEQFEQKIFSMREKIWTQDRCNISLKILFSTSSFLEIFMLVRPESGRQPLFSNQVLGCSYQTNQFRMDDLPDRSTDSSVPWPTCLIPFCLLSKRSPFWFVSSSHCCLIIRLYYRELPQFNRLSKSCKWHIS